MSAAADEDNELRELIALLKQNTQQLTGVWTIFEELMQEQSAKINDLKARLEEKENSNLKLQSKLRDVCTEKDLLQGRLHKILHIANDSNAPKRFGPAAGFSEAQSKPTRINKRPGTPPPRQMTLQRRRVMPAVAPEVNSYVFISSSSSESDG